MQTFIRPFRLFVFACFGVVIGVSLMFTSPAMADEAPYVTPDGKDITAVVECLPDELSEGDLQRAIAESGKDYLERVFQLKSDYSDYDIAAAEEEFQSCLESKGITPEAKRRQR
jgi:hypothetical protein